MDYSLNTLENTTFHFFNFSFHFILNFDMVILMVTLIFIL